MGATHKAELGRSVDILPHNGVIILYSLELGIVNHINLSVFGDKVFAGFNRFGSEPVNMIETDRAV